MSKLSRITLVVVSIFAIVFFAFAGNAFGQGKGNGHVEDQKHGFASGLKWPKSWKSKDKPTGDPKIDRYKGLSKKTGQSPQSLWAWYESEHARNPRLTHGQFVAANMIARNPRKGITTQILLDGLRGGDSIGQVLQRRGLSEKEIKEERTRVRGLMEGDTDYLSDDLDRYWKIKR